jgi:hypothetical protein
MAKSSDTARLEEVRTLLHQLQRIRSEPAGSGPQEKHERNPGDAAGRPEPGRSHLRARAVAGAALLVIAAAIMGALLLLDVPAPRDPPTAAVQPVQPAPPMQPVQPVQPVQPASQGEPAEPAPERGAGLVPLEQAQQMMLGGDVLGAREALLNSADSGLPDVAFALARSYDPNFLQSVTNPNAAPDIEQAALWYRRWHRAAVENGQVTDALRLERILRSMQ